MPTTRQPVRILACAILCLTMTNCSSFMSRSPENAGGQIAEAGPFVGSRFAYNNLYGHNKTKTNHLPKKILSPVPLIVDGVPSVVVDVFMLPFDWDGGTVPAADPRRSRNTNTASEDELRERMERRANNHGLDS